MLDSSFFRLKRLILSTFLLCASTLSYAQRASVSFKRIGVEDGLSHVTINTIFQDCYGFMWFGTTDGLNKFDGFQFEIFKNEPGDLTSLKNNVINTIFEDDDHFLWVGTNDGLHRFNRNTGAFVFVSLEPRKQASAPRINDIIRDDDNLLIASSNGIYKISLSTFQTSRPDVLKSVGSTFRLFKDTKERIWIGSTSQGLFRLESDGRQLEHYPMGKDDFAIWDIHQDKLGIIRVASNGAGLFEYDDSEDAFQKVQLPFNNDNILSILEDSDQLLWVGTDKGGLHKIDESRSGLTAYMNNTLDASSISSNDIRTIFEDREGVLWFGTWGGGLNKVGIDQYGFENYSAASVNGSDYALSDDFVHAVIEDEKGNTWVGTKNGLNKIDARTQRIEKYTEGENLNTLSANYIKALYEDHQGDLWVGTVKGLNILDKQTGRFRKFFHKAGDKNSIPYDDITFIYPDGDKVWLGTWSGLVSMDVKTKSFDYSEIPEALEKEALLTMSKDSAGKLWFGTYFNGVYCYDPSKKALQQFKNIPEDSTSLGNNRVWTIHTDSLGQVWIGTFGGGLNKVVREGDKVSFKKYTERDGLSNNAIIGILSDQDGHLWISGNKGISKFNPEEETFVNFDSKDGLQGDHFNVAYHKGKSGRLYFGGSKGLSAFNPKEVNAEAVEIKVVIDDFQLFNKSVLSSEEGPLSRNILNTSDFTLSYKEDVFSFGFGALYYNRIDQFKYAFKLADFDEEWRFTDASRRYITYTSIPAGNYTFQVKAANKQGHWGEITQVNVKILPPWWETWWFRISIVIIILFSIYLFYLSRIKIIERQKRLLESLVEERTIELEKSKDKALQDKEIIQDQADRLKALDKVKSRFFANISHELRTPLTLINAPLETLVSNGKIKDEEVKEILETAQRNGVGLLSLVEEILDLGKLDAGKLKLVENPVKLREFLTDILKNYEPGLQKRNIQLDFDFRLDDNLAILIDGNKSKKVIDNLLSNALKFTKDNISLTVDRNPDDLDCICLTVKDNGIGIHPNDLPHVFDRYYQSEQPDKKAEGGTGIGLSLAKELTGLLNGSLSVVSELNLSTTFTFEFPAKEVLEEVVTPLTTTDNQVLNSALKATIDAYSTKFELDKPTLLITEDHPEMRDFIAKTLEPYFHIKQAENGQMALDTLLKHPIDIVISDVMMPVMDGFELLESIRKTEKLHQVSIVMLTARADQEDKLHALTLGIDDYLTKPFSASEFLARIKNILENRIKVVRAFNALHKDNERTGREDILEFIQEHNLSEREVEVMQLLAKRFSNAEIAEKLFVSPNTVKYHIKNLYFKLEVTNRSGVIKKLEAS